MNAKRYPFIASIILLLLLPFLAGCGGQNSPSPDRTGSTSKGMLEKKDASSELNGRIQTLKEKFTELEEAPSHLSQERKKEWREKWSRSDSLLNALKDRVKRLEKGQEKKRARIDRMLQRLAAQAKSMEKALEAREKDHGSL